MSKIAHPDAHSHPEGEDRVAAENTLHLAERAAAAPADGEPVKVAKPAAASKATAAPKPPKAAAPK